MFLPTSGTKLRGWVGSVCLDHTAPIPVAVVPELPYRLRYARVRQGLCETVVSHHLAHSQVLHDEDGLVFRQLSRGLVQCVLTDVNDSEVETLQASNRPSAVRGALLLARHRSLQALQPAFVRPECSRSREDTDLIALGITDHQS